MNKAGTYRIAGMTFEDAAALHAFAADGLDGLLGGLEDAEYDAAMHEALEALADAPEPERAMEEPGYERIGSRNAFIERMTGRFNLGEYRHDDGAVYADGLTDVIESVLEHDGRYIMVRALYEIGDSTPRVAQFRRVRPKIEMVRIFVPEHEGL